LKKFKRFPIHPLLWALFPPLALLGNNITHMPPVNSIRTILVSIILAALVAGIFRVILRNWTKAALVSTSFLILFYSYGHIYNLIQNHTLFRFNFGRHRFLFPLFILVFIVLVVWVSRRRELSGVTSALNLIGMLALIFPLYQIVSFEVKPSIQIGWTPEARLLVDVANPDLPPGASQPDIYYIILDTYTRADTLSEFFSYDNTSFISELESRGFYVAGCSQSNYPFTALSLASSLNFNYPQTLSAHLSPDNKKISDVYPYIYNNLLAYTLHRLGYRFEAIESGYSPTEFKNADVYYSPTDEWQRVLAGDGINSFESMELNTSAGMLFYEFNSYLPPAMQKFLSAYVLHRERILYELSLLDHMAEVPGPKFVFVHILAPHNPFVFGPNGEPIERKTAFTLNDDREVVSMQDYISGYRDQVTYLNQRMLSIVDALIQDSNQPPIIIIQGDHGTPRIAEWDDTILNAYYLPGDGEAQLYQTISPVNTFRVVLNHYFGGKQSLLPDQSCNNDPDSDPYGCTPVVDPNPQCR